MALYTERHGMRTPIDKSSDVSIEVYALLLDCCKKYLKNLTHIFKLDCHDDFTVKDYVSFSRKAFDNRIKVKIPSLFRNEHGDIASPGLGEDYDQYSLFDLIEYLAQNINDISEGWNNQQYQNYWHIECLSTRNVASQFVKEINDVFTESGLVFTLTNKQIIERVIEYGVLSPQVETAVTTINEPGIRGLLNDALVLFRAPNPLARSSAVEKLWDAYERLKTYYATLDKKSSAAKIVTDMSGGQVEFTKLFEDEFKALTSIGNSFRIRHHETNKTDITDARHFDYFFNRCLSLIATAIHYLQ